MARKAQLKKVIHKPIVFRDGSLWNVVSGELKRGRGYPGTERLFRIVAEKIPFAAFAAVQRHFRAKGHGGNGVYIAHDSMGTPRYIGRGNIFARLGARFKAQPLELTYFSFYVVEDKKHEREIESLLIRAAGPLLDFNSRKKRVDIGPANIRDFEAGTVFYERQGKRGRRRKTRQRRHTSSNAARR